MHWKETTVWKSEKDRVIVYIAICVLAYASILIDYIASCKEDKIHTLKFVILLLLFVSYVILTIYQYKSKYLGGFIIVLIGSILSFAVCIHCAYIMYFKKDDTNKQDTPKQDTEKQDTKN
jgi:hypothetical protein